MKATYAIHVFEPIPNKLNDLISFSIDGDTLTFDDHGRLWMAKLSGGLATWGKNNRTRSPVVDQAAASNDGGRSPRRDASQATVM